MKREHQGMVKMTIELPEELKESLARLVREEGRLEEELILEAVQALVEKRRPPKPRLPLTATGLGNPSVAEQVDKLLADHGFAGGSTP